MKSKRMQALVLVAALAVGYGGAAVYTALAAPPLPLDEITDWGDGDGLTRYVVTASSGSAADVLSGLESVAGVAHAQDLGDGRALVATDGLVPQDLSGVPGVAGVELDVMVPVAAVPSDPYVAQYGWHLDNTGSNAFNQTAVPDKDTDAPDSWPLTTGEGMVVAVIDSGYDSDHPDMAGALWNNPAQPCGSTDADGNGLRGDCHGWNWYTNSADIDNGSDGEHGTSVSGTVGARANNGHGLAGIAPDVTIMPLVIGGGRTVSVTAGAAAIRYAVDHGADVINASWGGSFTGPALDDLRAAVAYAAAHDVLFVAAAGNDGLNRDSAPMYPASLDNWNVISVGASTAADTVSDFSAYGAASVDLFAPGTGIVSIANNGGYGASNGTSLAAPMVAAALALYKSVLPSATAAELKAALFADVDPVPAFAGRSVTGGRLTLGKLTGTPAESVRYAFTAMTSPAGTVRPAIGVTGATGSGDYEVAIGLGMEDAGEIWALSQKTVTLDGVSVATDDEGDARFDLGNLPALDGAGLAPTVELADGRYVLTVQLYRDGVPVGRTHAAPLLVGTSVPVDPAPGGSGGGSTPGGGTTPGGSGGGTTPDGSGGGTNPGGSGPVVNPGPSTPTMPGGGSTPGGTTPGGSGPGSTPGATDPDDGSTPADTPPGGSTPDGSTPDGTTPDGGTPDGGTTPGSGGTPGGGSTPGSGGTPGGGTTPDGNTTPSTPAAPGDDTTTYPSVGAFRITSLGPNTVDTAGGARVTITGAALPAGARVLVGSASGATVIRATTTRVTFRAPARVAGTYDVTVFAPDGRSTVLSNALTYVDGLGTTPDGSTPDDPGTDGSTPDGTSPGGSTPGGSTPGGSTPGGSTPGGSTPGSSGAAPAEPVVRTGPSGERLVRSARFSALGSIWSMNCSSSCTGVAI
ncbi:S8 family serine peptidase [Candidatus Blastococcus massiliensis]|uniref:S8 family serine peptidase n=1 Tax=Candidatus Blastococcus massiliensis TaxID=1470358 RepID=UPI0004B73591|nr:S8 family serine peptidase [Candidatus Blastococcus massiliensis]